MDYQPMLGVSQEELSKVDRRTQGFGNMLYIIGTDLCILNTIHIYTCIWVCVCEQACTV